MNSSRAVSAACAALAMLAGCDYPTEPPIVQQRWVVPVQTTTLAVGEILPPGVDVAGSDFDISVPPVAASETLGNLCPSCVALDGLTAPVPAFTGSFQAEEGLPAHVLSADVSGGSIEVAVTNGLSFDPLTGGGSLTVTVTDGIGGAALGQVVIDGNTTTLDPGSTTSATLDLAAATISGPLAATVDVDSPGGEVATIDSSASISVTATVESLLVGSATIDVPNEGVLLDPTQLDAGGFSQEIVDRIISGTLRLAVTNPFAVSVDGTLDIGPTSKPFSIGSGTTSTIEIGYTGDELRSFLGQDGVTFSGSGTANGSAVTVTPGLELSIDADLDFTLEIG